MLVLALAALLPLVAAQASFTVVHAPEYVKFDAQAGAMRAGDVPNVLANVLGFESAETLVSWNGVLNGNVFRRPSASLSIVLDGFDETLPLSASRASFALSGLSTTNEVLLGHAAASTASVVAENTGSDSLVFSMSGDQLFATQGSSRDMMGSNARTIFFDSLAGFRDSSNTFSLSKTEIEALFSQGLLGSSVVLDATQQTATVSMGLTATAVVLSLKDPHCALFFTELHGMVAALQRALATGSLPAPAVFTFTVASARHLPVQQRVAAAVVLAGFVEKMTALVNAAFGNNALVTLVKATPGTVHHTVSARAAGTASVAAVGAVAGSSYMPKTSDPDYVAYCASYNCFCNKDNSGVPFTQLLDGHSCQKGCDFNTQPCQCAHQTCSCASPYRQLGSAQCATCQSGFVLQNGRCYVSSDYPGMFQIWFWGGLLITLGLLSTCYVIGGMDPGRNSVIYRMTSQRMKTN